MAAPINRILNFDFKCGSDLTLIPLFANSSERILRAPRQGCRQVVYGNPYFNQVGTALVWSQQKVGARNIVRVRCLAQASSDASNKWLPVSSLETLVRNAYFRTMFQTTLKLPSDCLATSRPQAIGAYFVRLNMRQPS
jgi:hypothetical protein